MALTVFSFGNSQRRDDGIAAIACARAIEELRHRDISWFDLGIHAEQLATYLGGATEVIVVDALKGSPVGEVMVMNLQDTLASHRARIRQCHGLSWLDEIALTRAKATITFAGINVLDDGWGEGLSPDAQAALPEVVRKLVELCKQRESCAHA